MIEQISNALTFTFFYSSLGLGTTGLTVTVDVFRNGSIIVTAASATEVGDGLYTYTLASGSVTVEGVYAAVSKTSTTTVDQQHLVAGWIVGTAGIENLDAAITSRLAPTTAGRTLDVSATGEAGVDWANVGSPTSTVGLTNTTVGTSTNLTNNQAKYMHGAVWINTVTGAAGTASYTNGIMTNPSNSLPNAKTIADNIFLKKFWIQAGSSIALSADMIGYVLEGASWTLSSASARNFSGTTIRGCENLTGLYTTPTQECYVYECQVGTSTWGEVDFHHCHITGTITLNAALPFLFDRCVGIPANSPIINFGAVADARSAVIKDFGGMVTITNMRAGNVLIIDGDCDLTIDATCTGGTVYINGNIRLTNNGTGQTIRDTSRYGEDQNVTDVTGAVLSVQTDISLLSTYASIFLAKDTDVQEIKAKTNNLPSDPADQSLLIAAIAAIPSSSAPTVGEIDAQLSDTHGAGSWVGLGDVTVNFAVSETDAATVASGELSITSYAQFAQSVTSTTTEDLITATKIWLAIKDSKSEADALSLVFVEKTGGLTVLAKETHSTPTDGSLIVGGSSGAWVIALALNAPASGLLHDQNGTGKFAEIKALVGGDVVVLWSGSATISQGVIRAIS